MLSKISHRALAIYWKRLVIVIGLIDCLSFLMLTKLLIQQQGNAKQHYTRAILIKLRLKCAERHKTYEIINIEKLLQLPFISRIIDGKILALPHSEFRMVPAKVDLDIIGQIKFRVYNLSQTEVELFAKNELNSFHRIFQSRHDHFLKSRPKPVRQTSCENLGLSYYSRNRSVDRQSKNSKKDTPKKFVFSMKADLLYFG